MQLIPHDLGFALRVDTEVEDVADDGFSDAELEAQDAIEIPPLAA